jgi:hypothetical protein
MFGFDIFPVAAASLDMTADFGPFAFWFIWPTRVECWGYCGECCVVLATHLTTNGS